MKKEPVTISYLVKVPESVVISAADCMLDDPYNSFARVLEYGREFKEAGMTPMYILDKEKMDIHVVAEETFGKKLN